MSVYQIFFLIAMIILSVLAFACMIRAVIGPKLADRVMAVNMIGTMVTSMIIILAAYLGETSILDIALIYALLSFVAVILLSKIYIGIYNEKKMKYEEMKKARKAGEEEKHAD